MTGKCCWTKGDEGTPNVVAFVFSALWSSLGHLVGFVGLYTPTSVMGGGEVRDSTCDTSPLISDDVALKLYLNSVVWSKASFALRFGRPCSRLGEGICRISVFSESFSAAMTLQKSYID